MPLILWGITALLGGYSIGSTVANATSQPVVNIQQGTVSTAETEASSYKKWLTYGAAGLVALFIYRKSRKW